MSLIELQSEKMIRELPVKSGLEPGYDWLIVEGKDGTKKMRVEDFLSNSLKDNLFFDNVNALSESENLTEGSVVYTKGFGEPGDGGGAKYEIRYDPGAPTNGYTIFPVKYKNTLKAFLSVDGFVTPEQLGASGNGETDDTDVIKRLLSLNTPILFNPNKKYKITENINIPSDSFLDFRGCTIILESSANISIKGVSNVTIENANINNINNGRGIFIYNSESVLISDCNINNILANQYGIEILDSKKVNIINNNLTNGSNNGRGVYIHGEYDNNTDNIIIRECNFDNIKEPVYLYGLAEMGNIGIYNCTVKFADHSSKNIAISNSSFKSSISINGLKVTNGYQVLNISTGSKSFISLSDISAYDTYSIYNLNGSKECIVSMTGNHNYIMKSENPNNDRYVMNMVNTMLLLSATFNISGYDYLNTGIIHNGFINDILDTKNNMAFMKTEDLDDTTGTLYIKDFRNCYINITGSTNVMVINRGIEGQMIEIVSSDELLLKDLSLNIELSEPGDITLHKYKGVKLIYLKGKWIQI